MPADIQAVVHDLNTNVTVERDRQNRTLALAALANANVCQLGPGGTGKSHALEAFTERITGARYFGIALNEGLAPDEVLGAIDIPALANQGVLRRNTTYSLPTSHIGFIDEFSRGNGPMLNSLFPILVAGKRQFKTETGMVPCDLRFVVLATNWMPDDSMFTALLDRITIMQEVEYVRSDESFKQILLRSHQRVVQPIAPRTITLEQFAEAQSEVRKVRFSDAFLDAYSELRKNARGEGLTVSDRRYVDLCNVARANAWMEGRSELNRSDVVVVEDGLWRDTDDRKLAKSLVLPFLSPVYAEAAKRSAEIAPLLAELQEKLMPGIKAAGDSRLGGDLMDLARDLSRKLGEANKRLTQTHEKAHKEGVTIAELDSAVVTLAETKVWFEDNYLPASWPK